MKYLVKFFLRGLLVLTPLCLSLYFIVWLFISIEKLAKKSIETGFDLDFYFPGLGIFCAVLVIIILGVLMSSLIAQKAHRVLENIIAKLPVLKTIYFAIDDFMNFFAGDSKDKATSKVVLVEITDDIDVVGIITNEDLQSLLGKKFNHKIAVYLPMSYQMGGYTVFVEQDKIKFTEFTVEEAMKLSMTAWIKKTETEISGGAK